jgi:hypothetical protein
MTYSRLGSGVRKSGGGGAYKHLELVDEVLHLKIKLQWRKKKQFSSRIITLLKRTELISGSGPPKKKNKTGDR